MNALNEEMIRRSERHNMAIEISKFLDKLHIELSENNIEEYEKLKPLVRGLKGYIEDNYLLWR